MSTIRTHTQSTTGYRPRAAIFAYSIVAYALGMTALVWLVASAAGLCPFGTGPLETTTTAGALAVNATLVVLFGVQHSVMARQRFKDWWTRSVPPAAERSTYVLTAGLALGLLLWLWQPMPSTIWSVSGPLARGFIWALFASGWLYLVAATFATNHFDLFGLRQAWLHLRERPYTPVPFVRHWMYRYSRHPMMAGILVGLWATPEMRADHLVLATGFTAYVAIGVAFEERELAGHFGNEYRRYCREVGALLPRLRA
ncbi:isoprenylcysteine carboxylmethyltransferase family protein [Ectothiorhodospiraceae bacterium WFHF3C12]|nr:isoprenylcysteine carboxylmethyltransferase family protein [Ectothiorhodospiraceae bacterium WFHF3C12]